MALNLFVLERTEEMQDLTCISSRVYTWDPRQKIHVFFC